MQSIYMNNFRGFSHTVIDLKQVNFLVGENSTGKTSVLALLQLLSMPDFWFQPDFNRGDYEFGGYSDVVSASSTDQTEFQIGMCRTNPTESKGYLYYMLHFEASREGMPRLKRFSQLSDDFHYSLAFSGRHPIAFAKENTTSATEMQSHRLNFEFLQEIPRRPQTSYRKLPEDKRHLLGSAPLFFLPNILQALFKNTRFEHRFQQVPFPCHTHEFSSIAPIRTKPQRTYAGYAKPFNPEGEHTPYVLSKRLRPGVEGLAFKKPLQQFGRRSALFRALGVSRFGKDNAGPFEITVKLSQVPLRMNSVGYGVSQALPIIVELLTQSNEDWLAIQQPEVHLHPRAQAALGEAMYEAARDRSLCLFVETHSDYLIDRFRICCREHPKKLAQVPTQVIFFERADEGNTAHSMILDHLGRYPKEQPVGFRGFFLTEQRRLLGV